MYLKNSFTYYRGTEQCTTRGLFLLLLQDKDKPIGPENFRAVVRKVALRQLGHLLYDGTCQYRGQMAHCQWHIRR